MGEACRNRFVGHERLESTALNRNQASYQGYLMWKICVIEVDKAEPDQI